MQSQWNGRRWAMVAVVGLVTALGTACASGPSQEDFDAMKLQVAALASKDQEAAAATQSLAAKLEESEAARQQLGKKLDESVATAGDLSTKLGITTAQYEQLVKDIQALNATAGTHLSKADSEAALVKTLNTADTKLVIWSIQPGTAPRMNELANYFGNLWYAGQAGNWLFAEFELYRVDETVKAIKVVRPKRAAGMSIWMKNSIEPLVAAVKAKDAAQFTVAYDNAVQECNNCHIDSEGGGFSLKGVKVTRPTSPMYSNIDYRGN